MSLSQKNIRKDIQQPANTVRAKLAVREEVTECVYIRIQKKSLFRIVNRPGVAGAVLQTPL